MFRRAHLSPFAVGFFVWFALWFVAGRYVSVDFYRLTLGEAAQIGLELFTPLVALALMIVPFMRARAKRSSRWSNAILCIGLLAIVEVVWRMTNALPWDFAKGLGIILDVATPALLALGMVAVVAEWRTRRSAAVPTAAGEITPA